MKREDSETRVDDSQYQPPLATAAENKPEPPGIVIEAAVQMSKLSPCRSKRGSVIFRGDDLVAQGYNFKPRGFDCDGSIECKATCRVGAIHAEQFALLVAGLKAVDAEMLHVKTVAGRLVPSGGPSCPQCSKLALAVGVKAMWLYHADGWRRYETTEWHRLSLEAERQPAGESRRTVNAEARADG